MPGMLGLEGDLLDALVLGPRLRYGTHLQVRAWAAVTLTDRGMSDDKLICSEQRPSRDDIDRVLRFFHFYARCKGLLNLLRRRPGRNGCDGLCTASAAIARARPLTASWTRPPIPF
jgi:inorganic pyrophosphatase